MAGANLRRLRERRGLTQEQLAEPESSRSYVSQVEHDLICPSAEALNHFAQRLGVDAAESASDDESAERQFWRWYRGAQRCRRRARWLEWRRNLADAARLARSRGDRAWEARCWAERAEGWRTRHQPRRAVGAYYQALALCDAAAAPLAALWIDVGGLHLAMGEPAPTGRAYRQALEAAGPSVEWRWRDRMGSAWASLLMGAPVRTRILFGQAGAAVAELGYAEWESLSLSGEAFCVYGSAPAEALAQFLRARALASAVRSGAALASAQLGVGLCRLAAADEGGLDDVRGARQLFDAVDHRLGLARALRVEIRALLCCGQAGEAEGLAGHYEPKMRPSDGIALSTWILEGAMLAHALAQPADPLPVAALSECVGVYRGLQLLADASDTQELLAWLRQYGSQGLSWRLTGTKAAQ